MSDSAIGKGAVSCRRKKACLDVIVEDEVVVAVALEKRLRAVDGEVLKLQHGVRVPLRDCRHKLVHEVDEGLALEAALAQAHVELAAEQLLVVGADVDHHLRARDALPLRPRWPVGHDLISIDVAFPMFWR